MSNSSTESHQTLKERLTELRIQGSTPNNVIEIELAIEIFKEWLERKRKKYDPGWCVTVEMGFIDELLEELSSK